jgi:hypothetical protein
MQLNTQDHLKKALLDTQERVRDFMHYSQIIKDKEIQGFFRDYAESEAYQARKLQEFIEQQ